MSLSVINLLTGDDSLALKEMLTGNSKEYMKYFTPFPFNLDTIQQILSNARDDKFWGVWIRDELAALFYLRGFDEGYKIPCYGVCVAEKFAGEGVFKETLQYSIDWCKDNNIDQLMLKVYPQNEVAKKTYESFGFVAKGHDPKNNNIIYYRDIS